MSHRLMGTAVAVLMTAAVPAFAETVPQNDIAALKAEIARLSARVEQMEQAQAASPPPAAPSAANAFNPAIGVIVNGHYGVISGKAPDIAGFGTGGEGGRVGKGLSLGESEVTLSANADDLFAASVTAALAEEDGETEVELEEAFIRTLGLPYGLGVKAGRFLTPIGYLNERHAHTDDFADRPLPSRVFLNGAYKDDGVMGTLLLPTDLYAELGAGVFNGADFPGGAGNGGDAGAWLGYARLGGDIGANQGWLFGLSTVQASPGSREGNDGTVLFDGDSDLYAASLRYVWDPTGNPRESQVTLQGEYFLRREDGTYDDTAAATGAVPFDGHQSGWYAQGVYRFAPQWRVGARYSTVLPDAVPAGLAGSALDSAGHDPWNTSVMADWTRSEFSRLRLQYTHEEPAAGQDDDQVILQYILAIGAHPAHAF